nr:hypothetical protein BaRGS_013325 [Batillaria attramentaria]
MREALNRDAECWRIVEDLASLGLYESQRRQIFYRAVLAKRDESGRKAAKVIRSDEKSPDGVSAKKTQKKKHHKEDSERKTRVETAISEGAKCGDWLLVMTVYEGRLGEDVKLLVLDEALIPVALERRQWSVLEAMVVRGVSPDDVDTVYREALTHRRWSLLAALVNAGLSDVMTHAAIHQALKCNEWTFIVVSVAGQFLEYLKSNLSSHDELCAVVEQAVEQGSWPLVAAILTPDIPDCLMSKALVKSTKSGNDLVAHTCIKIASGCRSSRKEGSARAAGKYSDVIHAADEDGSTVVQFAARSSYGERKWRDEEAILQYLQKAATNPAALKHQCRLTVSRAIGWRDRHVRERLPLFSEMIRKGADPTAVLNDVVLFTPMRSVLEYRLIDYRLPIASSAQLASSQLCEMG